VTIAPWHRRVLHVPNECATYARGDLKESERSKVTLRFTALIKMVGVRSGAYKTAGKIEEDAFAKRQKECFSSI